MRREDRRDDNTPCSLLADAVNWEANAVQLPDARSHSNASKFVC